MKRLLSKRKDPKPGSSSVNPSISSVDIAPTTSNQSNESHDESVNPIFQKTSNVDMNLNVNPTIVGRNQDDDDDFSMDTTMNDYSLFTGTKKSFSTKQSSYMSSGSSSGAPGAGKKEFGTALHTLNMVAEETDETTSASQIVSDGLVTLVEDVSFVVNQFNHGIINLTTCVINAIDCFKRFIAKANSLDKRSSSWKFTSENNKCVRQIIRYYLNFYDNLLKDEAYIKLKLLLVKHFNDFAGCLDSSSRLQTSEIVKPKNYAIGYGGVKLPNQEVVERIVEKISKSNLPIKEQSGSFLAPITRGITQELSILCLYFGYPEPNDYHFRFIQSLYELYDDIHMMIMKNKVELAATAATTNPIPAPTHDPITAPIKFKIPFRIPTDITQPPMSMSISLENSVRTSGTLGGYIYPIINTQTHPQLSYYAHSQFAITCGHVCLDGNKSTYPHVSMPSSVLISMYKNALSAQYTRSDNEAKVAYGSILNQLDQLFPIKKVKSDNNNTQQMRNLPSLRFGQIIWGERTLIENNIVNGISDVPEKRLSDLAIVKINKKLSCRNFLGDDIPFNEFDPGLMFDNLYIRKVINLSRYVPKPVPANTEVDSTVSSYNPQESLHGVPVFKYGSTTKYTRGNLNGIKLVYWQDGAIHSSEFIVNSPDNITPFASGGDSGSWILTKLEDIESDAKGLGVLGMLHSYDGEFRQFGLFTPMTEILTRLEEVTNIKWGVVGCEEKAGEEIESSESEVPSDSDSDSEVD
ncbi:uncharacterized protein SPAPADRAFT_134178 [Spathaspora passalidarum NRRL Y-27907]|uniref:SPS-sensor serine protease component SSY5 n=1 Tax=Spathaspora passalidarum (strain NRRL Y-27907 / 11-Y1) TaxID=619300 RepID=G3AJI3_SPAPN|nr:uncharacterized protein SPAPADRAFT_134178 [Spathaspora passalidarum NRRL Y-27907]EGW33886.1 hypothetical protein SPAPADRAFT_134178 [Spathaspora passalidarum NRRL Y-27907]